MDDRFIRREVDRPQQPEAEEAPDEQPGTSTPKTEQMYQEYIPMEKGELESDTDQELSVLELPSVSWAKNVGVKNFQYIKMGHAPKVNAEEPKDWDLGNAVGGTEKKFSTDLQFLRKKKPTTRTS